MVNRTYRLTPTHVLSVSRSHDRFPLWKLKTQMSPTNRSKTVGRRSMALVCLIVVTLLIFPVSESVPTMIETFAEKAPKAQQQNDNEARELVAAAESLRAEWTEASLREAIENYDKAADLWIAGSDFTKASAAILKGGDVSFVLSEYGEALKRYQKAVALAQKTNARVVQASGLSQLGRLYSYKGKNDLAEKYVTNALDLVGQLTNPTSTERIAHGEALSTLGEILYAKGDLAKARIQFERAQQLLAGDPKGEARVHLFAGYIAGSLGEPEKATSELSHALNLSQSISDKVAEGLALTALGLAHSLKRDENEAIKLHQQAIEIFRMVGDRNSQAIALNALGQAYENLSEHELALDNYSSALRLFEGIGALDMAAVSTFKVAKIYRLTGALDQALETLERCVTLSRAANKARTEANALNEIASVYESLGRPEEASKQYDKIYRFYKRIGDRRGQATALNTYGKFLLQTGKKQEALDTYNSALPLSEQTGDNGILLATLYNIAEAKRELGQLEAALSSIQRSLQTVEELRANVGSPDFRASYLSAFHKHYDLCIRILMQLERAQPNKGFAVAAFLQSEKSRARSLLDLLGESHVNLRQGATAELVARERDLRASLRSLAQYELDLKLNKQSAAELAGVARRRAELRAEYQDVQGQLREPRPNVLSLQRFSPASLEQIQDQLRDTDTMLLEYFLGDQVSYLWAISSNSFQSFELPPGRTVEGAATELYKLITARQHVNGQSSGDYQAAVEAADKLLPEKAKSLGQMLLGPVFDQLGNKKLLLVTEGALQYIPFAILPGPTGSPLIVTNEVTREPSISILMAIRAEKNRRRSPDNVVAVIADPVFSRSDDRVQAEGLSPAVASAATNQEPDKSAEKVLGSLTRGGAPVRLTHSSEEADAILAAAPRGTTMVAKGFDATSETVMSADIGKYQIVHLATHGFLDSEHPELSGIVLTMVDRNGASRNGLMPLHDIYNLDLSAELTVLSACQTALGKDVKGEGLVGLTHSFLSAGSRSVVASLWKVDDRATAALMTEFYNSMLQEGMPTAAALRAAKLKMMQHERWRAPYYWAGFVLQGEYTNRIAVHRDSSLSYGWLLPFLLAPIATGLIVLYRRRRRSSRVRRV